MAEDAAAPAHASAAGAGDQAQTVEVPVSAIGGAKEGDMVTFKVVSVDQQGGMANLAPAAGAPEEDDMGGADGMADQFKKENMKETM